MTVALAEMRADASTADNSTGDAPTQVRVDVGKGSGAEPTMSTRMAPQASNRCKLIDSSIKALHKVKILLIEPFILPVGKRKDDDAKYRKAVEQRQIVVARIAAKYNLPVVHLHRAMDEACKKAPPIYWSWHGIHPNYAGHGLLALEWMKTVDQAWR